MHQRLKPPFFNPRMSILSMLGRRLETCKIVTCLPLDCHRLVEELNRAFERREQRHERHKIATRMNQYLIYG